MILSSSFILTAAHQIIGVGNGVVSVGNGIVDSDLLCWAGIASALNHHCEFTSNLLVQKLTSLDYLETI